MKYKKKSIINKIRAKIGRTKPFRKTDTNLTSSHNKKKREQENEEDTGILWAGFG